MIVYIAGLFCGRKYCTTLPGVSTKILFAQRQIKHTIVGNLLIHESTVTMKEFLQIRYLLNNPTVSLLVFYKRAFAMEGGLCL